MTTDPASDNVTMAKAGEAPVNLTVKRWLPVAVLVLGAAAFFLFGLDQYFTFDSLRDNRASLLAFVAGNRATAMLAFIAIYTAVVAMSLPMGGLLTITGGFLFGVLQASICVEIGATLGATILFLVARSALGESLRAKAGRWLDAVEQGLKLQENALYYLLFLRLVPIFPFFVVNLVPAFLGVRLGTFVLATAVGMVPAIVVFSLVGAGLGSILDSGQEFSVANAMTPEVVAALVGLGVLALIPVLAKVLWDRRRR
jgi:uncharacterized membrane protein YdjX (TVP38/TMEM64 family)